MCIGNGFGPGAELLEALFHDPDAEIVVDPFRTFFLVPIIALEELWLEGTRSGTVAVNEEPAFSQLPLSD